MEPGEPVASEHCPTRKPTDETLVVTKAEQLLG